MMSVVVCSRLKGSRANANNDLDILKHLKKEISQSSENQFFLLQTEL